MTTNCSEVAIVITEVTQVMVDPINLSFYAVEYV